MDAVVLGTDGKISVRQGQPRAAAPAVPNTGEGERHAANIHISGFIPRLGPDHVFPVLERVYPEPSLKETSDVIVRVAHTLSEGQPLRVLAWGESVTDGSYLADKSQRWQEQFVSRLRQLYPKAKIELITQAWRGRNTGSYLAEPPCSPHNCQQTVLDQKPDLIISEFVYMMPDSNRTWLRSATPDFCAIFRKSRESGSF